MSKIIINLPNKIPPYTTILADNKPLKFESASQKSTQITTVINTNNPEIDIKIIKYSTLGTKLWFLYELIFFFISFFGIFEMYERNSLIVDCCCNFKINSTQDSTVNLTLLPVITNAKVVKFDEENNISIISNDYILNEKLKKRKKISKTIKCLIITSIFLCAIGILSIPLFL